MENVNVFEELTFLNTFYSGYTLNSDLYNTYLNKGLPPLPICFPGIKSIEATLNPDQNEYFYFVPKVITWNMET